LVAVLCAAAAFGQQKLDLKFDALAAKAAEKVEIDLDSGLLKLLLKMSGQVDRELGGWLGGLKAIRVRSYTFDKTGVYSDKDLETVRKQVNSQSRFARVVTSKEDEESTEIWVAADGDKLGACFILVAEPRELNVVYLEGTLSMDQIKGMMDRDGVHGFLRLAEK